MTNDLSITSGETSRSYLPISIESYMHDKVIPFSLYQKRGEEYVLFISEGYPLSEELIGRVTSLGVKIFYIAISDRDKYLHFIEDNIKFILGNENIRDRQKASLFYATAKDTFKNIFDKEQNTLSPEGAEVSFMFVEKTFDFVVSGKKIFFNLLSVLSPDYTTVSHSINVYMFSMALGSALGFLDDNSLVELVTSAILHDIGKKQIPDEVLYKKGKLTPEDWELIRRHPIIGYEIATELGYFSEMVMDGILSHHEKLDGSGYPYGKKGNELSEFAKIIAVADVYDALTSPRPYGEPETTFNALWLMKNEMINALDGDMVKTFISLFSAKAE